jgi:hypothetical protein
MPDESDISKKKWKICFFVVSSLYKNLFNDEII